jgi:hypothetical protein
MTNCSSNVDVLPYKLVLLSSLIPSEQGVVHVAAAWGFFEREICYINETYTQNPMAGVTFFHEIVAQ